MPADDLCDPNLIASIARFEGKVDGYSAILTTIAEQNKEAHRALFATQREHADAISALQRDYVPRAVLERHETQSREDEAERSRQAREDEARRVAQIASLETRVTKIMVVAGVIYGAIQLLALVWSKL